MGPTQRRSPAVISIQLRESERKELVVISDLPQRWETEVEDELQEPGRHAERRRLGLRCAVREGTCAGGGDWELPAPFLHELVSRSMGAADCSMAAPGPTLPLCQDLTSLDYHHNIHQLSSAYRPPPSLLPCLPLPAPHPQHDPSSWILSEWHPLNLPN